MTTRRRFATSAGRSPMPATIPIVIAEPEEVILAMEESRPDLALLDVVLPDADGIAVMRDVLSVADVPVIFISAYGRGQVVARAFEAGADDYIVKPFSPTELVARVRAALRRRAGSHQFPTAGTLRIL